MARLPNLHTLELSRNQLHSLDDIAHLVHCKVPLPPLVCMPSRTARLSIHATTPLSSRPQCALSLAPRPRSTSLSPLPFPPQALNVLDLSHNRLDDPRILSVFEAVPKLRVLYLQGNPATQRIADVWGSYRKMMLARLQGLTFLDERPVHKHEMRFSVAWLEGGMAAESQERVKVVEELEGEERTNQVRGSSCDDEGEETP